MSGSSWPYGYNYNQNYVFPQLEMFSEYSYPATPDPRSDDPAIPSVISEARPMPLAPYNDLVMSIDQQGEPGSVPYPYDPWIVNYGTPGPIGESMLGGMSRFYQYAASDQNTRQGLEDTRNSIYYDITTDILYITPAMLNPQVSAALAGPLPGSQPAFPR